jgi:hypothetical protein
MRGHTEVKEHKRMVRPLFQVKLQELIVALALLRLPLVRGVVARVEYDGVDPGDAAFGRSRYRRSSSSSCTLRGTRTGDSIVQTLLISGCRPLGRVVWKVGWLPAIYFHQHLI